MTLFATKLGGKRSFCSSKDIFEMTSSTNLPIFKNDRELDDIHKNAITDFSRVVLEMAGTALSNISL